ncbi:tetratricopeptide repeat protein [Kordiimonas aquimaris]|uniref:tetratricopeptide repeat protein n=1 Tax=Kordiimonas aquimaris TaxID=707591 RepID=UPI0021CFFF11|nr:hypothetical protein [Kordiimonas aquimaris]
MFNKFKSIPMALAAAAIIAVTPVPEGSPLSSSAAAQDAPKNTQKTRKVPAMSLDVHKKVQKAQEAIDISDLATAKEILAKTLTARKINEYERAVVWQMNAMIAFEEEDTPATIDAYEKILTFRESIPVAQEMAVTYGLGQLYFSIEDYDKAVKYITDWENAVDPSLIGVSQLSFIATLHYQKADFPKVIDYIYKAIAQAESLDTVEVKENWYNLALSAHWELEQFTKVRDVLEILLIRWPNPTYWTQLAGVYQTLDEEQTSYSLTEAAYKQGFLDEKPLQIVNVAQIQRARSAPIKCAWVIDRALKEELVENNAENQRLLGECYLQATEFQKALAPLSIAAREESDGNLWLQIGQVQMQLDRYDDAVKSFDNMSEAYESDKDSDQKLVAKKLLSGVMMKGQALTELKRFKEAKDAFRRASRLAKEDSERRAVANWRKYLTAEEQREQLLTGR